MLIKMKNFSLVIILLLFPIFLTGQVDSTGKTNSLKDDVYLHPIDIITPYTLKQGEWIYAQSIQTLPFPSWAFVGITNKFTVQIDLLPWLFGVFSDMKKPIPSLNFRYRINKQKGLIPTIAFETMFVYFWDTLQRIETQSISIWEKGSYFHFKPVIGYKIRNNWNINISAGIDFIGKLIMQNNETINFQTKTFNNCWNPNFSIGIGYRPSDWISYHIGYTYGSTLTYLENIPRKSQLTYGFRLAPFYKSRLGILRNLRIELVAINAYFADVKAKQSFPIPIFPYFYWQWKNDIEKKNKK